MWMDFPFPFFYSPAVFQQQKRSPPVALKLTYFTYLIDGIN
jgi:hypothetical protein